MQHDKVWATGRQFQAQTSQWFSRFKKRRQGPAEPGHYDIARLFECHAFKRSDNAPKRKTKGELLGPSLADTAQGMHEDGFRTALQCITAAVEHLHTFEYAHRDIKPFHMLHRYFQNKGCISDWTAKFVDFDAAEMFCSDKKPSAKWAYGPIAFGKSHYSLRKIEEYALAHSFQEIGSQSRCRLHFVQRSSPVLEQFRRIGKLVTPCEAGQIANSAWGIGNTVKHGGSRMLAFVGCCGNFLNPCKALELILQYEFEEAHVFHCLNCLGCDGVGFCKLAVSTKTWKASQGWRHLLWLQAKLL